MPSPSTRLAAVLLVGGLSLLGCDARGTLPEADLGAAVGATTVIGPGDVLVAGGWPEAASFVARATAAGRPVLVNAFASWCEPCRDEVPEVVALAARHPDLQVLGINTQDDADLALAMVEELGITYPTLFDRDGDVVVTLRQAGMPVSVLFDDRGEVVHAAARQLTRAELEAWIADVLPS